ncbi:MAG: hypothetical protein NTY03_15380 [Candidatus Bathyarchaeota archaeon]|nr:hypothetical protein [Candidatus Bathyarchaeota archaeon]
MKRFQDEHCGCTGWLRSVARMVHVRPLSQTGPDPSGYPTGSR